MVRFIIIWTVKEIFFFFCLLTPQWVWNEEMLYQNDGKRRVWGRKGWSFKADHIICQTWWGKSYGMGLCDCQWNWVTNVYWWCDYWWKIASYKFFLDSQHTVQAIQQFIKAKSPDLNLPEHGFYLLNTNMKAENLQTKKRPDKTSQGLILSIWLCAWVPAMFKYLWTDCNFNVHLKNPF